MPPKTTFLSLPREIRDMIYYYSLLGSSPIMTYTQPKRPGRGTPKSRLKQTSTSPSTTKPRAIDSIALGLLWTNFQVYREAVPFLYSGNTFVFATRKSWSSLWHFLYYIGDKNRARLRSLVVQMKIADKIYQCADGTLFDRQPYFWDKSPRQICIPEVHPPLDPSAPIVEGEVDPLDPAMRGCLRKLGSVGSKLQLTIELDDSDLPGVLRYRHATGTDSTYIAEILERFAAEETGGRVNVMWRGMWKSRYWDYAVGRLDEAGWELMRAQERENGRDTMVHFEVRRRGFTGLDGS